MAKIYHGLVLYEPEKLQFRFGIDQLIRRISLPTIWKILPQFHTKTYTHCHMKLRDTLRKFERSVKFISNSLAVLEEKDSYSFDGASLENVSTFVEEQENLHYHLDSLISYLRILADVIAVALPYFYDTNLSIAHRSFRDHRKWFEKNQDFDPEYLAILLRKTSWFDELAGRGSKGIRNANFHRLGRYQVLYQYIGNLQKDVIIEHLSQDGGLNWNLQLSLASIIEDFFDYLDSTYELFINRFQDKLSRHDGVLGSAFFNSEEFSVYWTTILDNKSVEGRLAQYRLIPFYDLSVHVKE